MLTITIPTFDRNQELKTTLNTLLPEVEKYADFFQLLIIDNCSPQPVKVFIDPLISCFPTVKVLVHRNLVNVGLPANLLRCFEFCQTEWMWLLGDDDSVYDNACELIVHVLREYTDCHFIHFASNLGKRETEFTAVGLSELLKKIDNYDNFNFISVGLYRVSFFRRNIYLGYLYNYTISPHIVILLISFYQENLKAFFCKNEIVEHRRPSEEKAWSRLEFYHRLFIILEIPCLNHEQRILLYQKIRMNRRIEEYIVTHYLLKAIQDRSSQDVKFKLDHSLYRIFYYDQNLFRKIKIEFYKLLFLNPSISISIIDLLLKFLQKPQLSEISNLSLTDRL